MTEMVKLGYMWRRSVTLNYNLFLEMATTESKKTPPKPVKGKTLTTEEIYNGFQMLRTEQRNLINKLSEVEMDLNEHK